MRGKNERVRPVHRGQAGVTLIELMVALVVSSVAVAAGLSLAFSMMNGFKDHQRSMAVERAARTATDYIANAVRSSSPGVATGEIVNLTGTACGTNRPGLEVVNSSTDADELRVFHATGGVFTSIAVGASFDCTGGSCPNTVSVLDVTGFSVGDTILITGDHTQAPATDHTGEFHIGYAMRVTAIAGNDLIVDTTCGLSTAGAAEQVRFHQGALVIRSRYSIFRVDTTNYPEPTLVMDAYVGGATVTEPLAEGIEDFQVAVAVDNNPTDESITEAGAFVNDDEMYGNVASETGPTAMGLGATPWRALRTTIVARSTGETQTSGVSKRPAVEDRPEDVSTTPYKRRTLTTIIELRNMEGSP